jgi:hypothetical protein
MKERCTDFRTIDVGLYCGCLSLVPWCGASAEVIGHPIRKLLGNKPYSALKSNCNSASAWFAAGRFSDYSIGFVQALTLESSVWIAVAAEKVRRMPFRSCFSKNTAPSPFHRSIGSFLKLTPAEFVPRTRG